MVSKSLADGLDAGVWFCGKGACTLDRQVSVTIVLTRPTDVCEHIVTRLLFDYLWRDDEFDQPRQDEEGIAWTFSRLYYLIVSSKLSMRVPTFTAHPCCSDRLAEHHRRSPSPLGRGGAELPRPSPSCEDSNSPHAYGG